MNPTQNEMAILHALRAIEAHVSGIVSRAEDSKHVKDAEALLGTVRQTIVNAETLLNDPVISSATRLHDLLSRAWEALDGEEESVKEEHADLIQEMSDLLDELNPGTKPEPVDHVYTFDLELSTTIQVTAPNLGAARNLLQEYVNGTEANLGSWPNGDPILCQVSMPDDTGTLAEIDGEAV